MIRDLRQAIRQLAHSPAFAIISMLTLGIGVGVAASIFCLLDGLWFRPMSVPRPAELVRLYSVSPQEARDNFSYPEFQQLQKNVPALRSVVAKGPRGGRLVRPDGSLRMLLVNVVSTNFFEDLGIQAAAGRLFTSADDDRLRVAPAVVLGHAFWMDEFGGNPAIVGQQIQLMRRDKPELFTVMGVLPDSFRETDSVSTRDLWLPPQTWERLNGPKDFEARGFRWFELIGRLAPGNSVRQANAQLQAAGQSLAAQWPATNKNRAFAAISDLRYRMNDAGTTGEILLAVVGMIVLLVGVNVAQLLLARGLARQREFAVRQALGADRFSIIRPFLAENLVIGAGGLGIGLLVAMGSAAIIPSLLLFPPGFTPGWHFGADWRVFLFAAAVCFLSVLLVSVIPVWRAMRLNLLSQLKSSGSSPLSDAHTSLAHRWLVATQVGVAVALLVSTGVLVRSFLNTRTQDLGMTRAPVLTVWVWQNVDNAMQKFLVAQERLQQLPGVIDVAYAVRAPLSLSEGGMAYMVTLPDHPELKDPIEVKYNGVSANFLQVMGTPVLRGRTFTAAEVQTNAPVIVINEAMAHRYWPGADPLGKLVHLAKADFTIIGIARNAPVNAVGEIPEPYLYRPFESEGAGQITYLLATRPGVSLAKPVREALVSLDPTMDPISIISEGELVRYSAGQYQMTAELVSLLGLVGLLLTASGLYGFISYRVTQRTREIGIRMALGSTQQRAVRVVMLESAKLFAYGLLIGLPLSLLATNLASSMLFGVRPLDVPSWCVACIVLLGSLFLASYIPARRATRIEPLTALRME
jgi:putative ABC transport system permease protein